MNKRIPKQFRIKGGTRHPKDWEPLYVRDQQHQPGIEFQHYAMDAQGNFLCAGVTRHERMSKAVANQIKHVWQVWRKEYIANNPGNYPLAEHSETIASLIVFPIGNHESKQVFSFEEVQS